MSFNAKQFTVHKIENIDNFSLVIFKLPHHGVVSFQSKESIIPKRGKECFVQQSRQIKEHNVGWK